MQRTAPEPALGDTDNCKGPAEGIMPNELRPALPKNASACGSPASAASHVVSASVSGNHGYDCTRHRASCRGERSCIRKKILRTNYNPGQPSMQAQQQSISPKGCPSVSS